MSPLTYSERVRSNLGTANSGASGGASVKRQRSTQPAGLKYSLIIHLTLTPSSLRSHLPPLVMKQGCVMLKTRSPPGRSTRKLSRIARSKRGPSMSAMNEITASKRPGGNTPRSVYEVRRY